MLHIGFHAQENIEKQSKQVWMTLGRQGKGRKTLTISLKARFFQHCLFGLFNDSTLEASIIDQRTTTGWISIL